MGYVKPTTAKIILDVLTKRDEWTLADLARKSGVNTETLERIIKEKQQWIQRDTLEKILDLPVYLTETDRRQPGDIGITRRIRALRRVGYSKEFLSEYSGLNSGTLLRASNGNTDQSQLTRDTIRETYRRLIEKPQPEGIDGQSLNYARGRGWHPPEAWAGVDIDDPNASPS